MLQGLREHIQGWIAGVIASILCLAFALWGIEYYISNSAAQVTVAKVDSEIITKDQLEIAYNRVRQSQQFQMNDPAEDETFQKQLKDRTLNELIKQTILDKAAHQAGYIISPAQVGTSVEQMPSFQLNGKFSPALFQQTLANVSYNPTDFLKEVSKNNLLQQMQKSIVESNFALSDDINRGVALKNQKRDFGYFLIPVSMFLTKISVSDKEVEDYYKSHSANFGVPEQVKLQYLLLSAKDVSKKLTVSDQEITKYYNDNKTSFVSPQRWRVARILVKMPSNADQKIQQNKENQIKDIAAQLKLKKSFAALAKKYSEDTKTSSQGGMLGWLTRAQQPELIETVSSLKPGGVSEPFKTQEGWNVVELIAVEEAASLSLASVKDQIRKTLLQEKTEQLISKASDDLANLTYTHPDTLQPAANALSLPVQTTAFFSRQGDKSGLLANPKILSAAFSDNVLKQRNNSDVISVDNNTVAVVRIADYKAAATKPLSEVRIDIEKILKQEGAQKATADLGKKVLQAMNQGVSTAQLAKQNKLTWVEKKGVERSAQDKKMPIGLLNFVFNQPAPEKDKKVIQSKMLGDNDYVIIELSKVSGGAASVQDVNQNNMLIKQMGAAFGALDADLYLTQRMSQAKISVMPSP